MAAVKPNVGRIFELDTLIGTIGPNLELRLFKSNTTPTTSSVYADFTEADFSGYAQQPPVFGTPATIDGNGNAKSDAPALTYTHNGGATANNVYGYYVVDTTGPELLWAERFASAPLSFAALGDNVVITPHWYDGIITPPL